MTVEKPASKSASVFYINNIGDIGIEEKTFYKLLRCFFFFKLIKDSSTLS